ncbi:primosomal protein N' [Basilea psittacipulmonis]|uniref:Replication restart protein PriA n=1 Tax=Basilea psittacipulmonis DSM 24701 TaxID=1072685 RepID=A0A077DC09_9BURK|nr:primosomal protein N' [Basilea psittacipulmonis]AIL32189.1 primosomal protein DnaI [Basilea psittacipulmonis DSM 24701]
MKWVEVVLDVPLRNRFVYRCSDERTAVGYRVLVPFGHRTLVGIIVDMPTQIDFPEDQIKDVIQVITDLPPFDHHWIAFSKFAAKYYQRPLGEVMVSSLPAPLRKAIAYQDKLAEKSPVYRADKSQEKKIKQLIQTYTETAPAFVLNDEQERAVNVVLQEKNAHTYLLFGVTGSGKTEVYLRLIQNCLEQGKQALFLVPEINLTPQFESQLRKRLGNIVKQNEIAVLHSNLSEGQRVKTWSDAQRGNIKLLLGTRLSIFSPLFNLGLIVVDEEHDLSYKQQEGIRYSARDLAVYRGRQLDIPVVLGSATPSLESWHNAMTGKYQLLELKQRAVSACLPEIKLVPTRKDQMQGGFSLTCLHEIDACLSRKEQVLVFINRRGYAPVLTCSSCEWVSECPNCTAYMVLHQSSSGKYLQCHHCGHRQQVPFKCPDCGNIDLITLGYGTQKVTEFLQQRYPQAKVVRIDADSTRQKGSAQALFEQVHHHEVDILVGTQMITKGHDFKTVGAVIVLGADFGLFSADFRSSERLFDQLIQVSGRAGRHQQGSNVWIQTDYPHHMLYQNLIKHDYVGFSKTLLEEREEAMLPPFSYQCLLLSQDKHLDKVLAFLTDVKQSFEQEAVGEFAKIECYDPVPLKLMRVDNIERAQLLIESMSRPLLQTFFSSFILTIEKLAKKHKVKYVLEVDPQSI